MPNKELLLVTLELFSRLEWIWYFWPYNSQPHKCGGILSDFLSLLNNLNGDPLETKNLNTVIIISILIYFYINIETNFIWLLLYFTNTNNDENNRTNLKNCKLPAVIHPTRSHHLLNRMILQVLSDLEILNRFFKLHTFSKVKKESDF